MSANITAWTCAQFEGVLSEYREGTLPDALARLARQHVSHCTACTALVDSIAETQSLLALLPELDPPARLLSSIMAQTLPLHGFHQGRSAAVAGCRQGWSALWASFTSPRFALGVAMSVFAIALLLNAAQINLGQLFRTGNVEQLSPAALTSAITRNVNRAWARGVAYYHDLRVVYEIEAAIHQMRRSQPPSGAAGGGHNRSDSSAAPGPELAENTLLPQRFGAPYPMSSRDSERLTMYQELL